MNAQEFRQETSNRKPSNAVSSATAYKRFLPLHERALTIAKSLRHWEYELIEILQLIDKDRGYRVLKYKSLYQYAVIALGLSEDRAYIFIAVARKAASLALMQETLKTGKLKISKAKKLCSVISKDNQKHWLDLAKNLSQHALERAIAKKNPKTLVEEGMKFLSENVLEFRAAIDMETEREIRRAQDVLSQSLGRAATYNEVLKAMAKAFVKAKDPVVRADRILKRKAKKMPVAKTESVPIYWSRAQSFRTRIPNGLKHQVNARDRGRCQEKYESGICGDSRWTDIHHLIPVSQGGQNTLGNLTTLCRAHHKLEHSELQLDR